jgi:hypothetical protein
MLNLKKCEAHIEHSLDGPIGAPISTRELAAMAGSWLYSAHTWSFTKARHKILIPRPFIAVTGATWADGTLTLTKVGAFANYTFVNGDYLTVDAGANVDKVGSKHEILSRPNDDSITLKTSIGAAADTDTDIGATLPNNIIPLPDGVRSISAIDTDGANSEGFRWITDEEIVQGQTGRFSVNSSAMRGVLIATQNGTIPGSISLAIEVEPSQTAPANIHIRYRMGWTTPTDDEVALPLPAGGELDMLFLQALLAHANALDKEDAGALQDRLGAITGSDYWKTAKRLDGGKRTNIGPIRGSAIHRRGFMRAPTHDSINVTRP